MEMELHNIFDDFISGRMDADQQAEFEERLEKDAAFKKEYVRYICLIEGINKYERERLKRLITDDSKAIRRLNTRPARSLRITFAAAAVIFLLLIPGFVIYKNIRFPHRIYKQFYYDDPGLPVVMGSSRNAALDGAMIEYKDKNYSGALNNLESMLAVEPNSDTLNYYSGICYLQTKRPSDALSCFNKITNAASPYYYLSKYYSGLAYIKLRDYSEAQNVLSEVLKCGDCFIAAKAKALIDEL